MSWIQSAACATPDVDPRLFFPVVEGRAPRGWERKARVICRGCEVKRECLDVALSRGESEGIWGGLTGWERHLQEGGPRPTRGHPRP